MSNTPVIFDRDQINLLKSTVAKGTDDNQLKLFMHVCQKTGLDPLSRQIYCVLRKDHKSGTNQMTIQTSIDGFRLIAQRSQQYAGQLGPQWCDEDGVWLDVWLKKKSPAAARVGVLRHDFKEPLWGVARFDAYAQRFPDGNLMGLWGKMPDVMIAKCAESLALRKAFPQELSGIYTSEEMTQAEPAKTEERDATPKLNPKYNPNHDDYDDRYIKEPEELRADSLRHEPALPGSVQVADIVNQKPLNHAPTTRHGISEAQLKRLFAISKKANWSQEAVKLVMAKGLGLASTKDLTRKQYDTLTEAMELGATQEQTIEKLKSLA